MTKQHTIRIGNELQIHKPDGTVEKLFLEDQEYCYYTKGYKYQISQSYCTKIDINPPKNIITDFIILTADGWLYIKSGYAYDGASGPTYDSSSTFRGALAHDGLFQLMRMGLLDIKWFEQANKELFDDLVEDNMWYIRAKIWHWGVDDFSRFAALPSSRKEQFKAPAKKRKPKPVVTIDRRD